MLITVSDKFTKRITFCGNSDFRLETKVSNPAKKKKFVAIQLKRKYLPLLWLRLKRSFLIFVMIGELKTKKPKRFISRQNHVTGYIQKKSWHFSYLKHVTRICYQNIMSPFPMNTTGNYWLQREIKKTKGDKFNENLSCNNKQDYSYSDKTIYLQLKWSFSWGIHVIRLKVKLKKYLSKYKKEMCFIKIDYLQWILYCVSMLYHF